MDRQTAKRKVFYAPAANRTRGPSMATMDFTTKPLALVDVKRARRWPCVRSVSHHDSFSLHAYMITAWTSSRPPIKDKWDISRRNTII
ncbi:hypothetical protein QBC45DRAFT_317221 [Copromyces sp. CBS 386.78]|nr:hypothetical protein QBC45DRAFT_317221 [Copromyces sp. CBS 386.78]